MTSWPEVSNDKLVCQAQEGQRVTPQESKGKKHRGRMLEAVERDDLQVVLRARLEVAGPDFCLGKV